MSAPHLVVVGFSQLVSHKYVSCFKDAYDRGEISGYSIIDLQSQEVDIHRRCALLDYKPEAIFFIPDRKSELVWADKKDFEPIFQKLIGKHGKIKVYIATEVKAHEEYLRFCIENDIDSLIEKPIVAPVIEGAFDPAAIGPIIKGLAEKVKSGSASHSVMTLSRYHKIYNDVGVDNVKSIMERFRAPITSFHFRTAGGVWNLHREFESREDHPYKYGYGMLMHGAYHYIDLIAQFLKLNREILPDLTLGMTLTTFAAFPADQNNRIPKGLSEVFGDHVPDWERNNPRVSTYGETDIVTVFRLFDTVTNKTVTLGSMSFEQTSPSIRSWKELPADNYNKNGRVSSVDLEVQLSTIYSMNIKCFDVPIKVGQEIDRIDATARVFTRTNASLLVDAEYNTETEHEGLFHSDSNRLLISNWLGDHEERSQFLSHVSTMLLIQALAISIKNQGQSISFNLE